MRQGPACLKLFGPKIAEDPATGANSTILSNAVSVTRGPFLSLIFSEEMEENGSEERF